MNQSTFVYATYIRTTPEKLWHALTTAETLKQCWMGASLESDWKAGSPWRAASAEGRLYDTGEVLESVPPKKLVLLWQSEWNPAFKAEGVSRCIYEIEPVGTIVKFTITHSIEHSDSKFIASIADAWPIAVSNIKSLLETGDVALPENPRHAS